MNVPKIRFSNFDNEWFNQKLKDISNDISYGMNSASKEYDGKNAYIRITDIDENTGKFDKNNLVSPDGILEDKFLVKDNDILFARTGASTGKTYLYNVDDGRLYYAGFLIKANIKDEYSSNFIYQQTKTNKYNKWVKIMSMRSGQPGINSEEYGSYNFSITSKKEQDKISKLFEMLDSKIELQSKKVEALKLYKKSVYYSFIDKFNKIKKLSEFGTLKNGYAFKNNLYSDAGNYNVLTISNVTGEKYISDNFRNKYTFLPTDIQEHQVLKENDILISLTGNVGRVSLNKGENNLLNQRVGVFKLYDQKNSNLIFQFLRIGNFEKKMIDLGQGAAQLNISKSDVEDFEIMMFSEGKYNDLLINLLDKIDEILIYNEMNLKNLCKLKKGLMQNMFI